MANAKVYPAWGARAWPDGCPCCGEPIKAYQPENSEWVEHWQFVCGPLLPDAGRSGKLPVSAAMNAPLARLELLEIEQERLECAGEYSDELAGRIAYHSGYRFSDGADDAEDWQRGWTAESRIASEHLMRQWTGSPVSTGFRAASDEVWAELDRLRRAKTDLLETLAWVRKNYAAGSTVEINARIDAAIELAQWHGRAAA